MSTTAAVRSERSEPSHGSIKEPRAFVHQDTDGRVCVHGEAALARGVVWLVQGHYGVVRVRTRVVVSAVMVSWGVPASQSGILRRLTPCVTTSHASVTHEHRRRPSGAVWSEPSHGSIKEPPAFVDEDTDGRVGVHGEAALARGVVWLVQGHYGVVRVRTRVVVSAVMVSCQRVKAAF